MTRIEEQLRSTFEAQLTDPPVAHDPAGAAIARAGTVRRRRAVVGTVAAVAVVIAVVAGIGLVKARDEARPTPPATRQLPVDVVDGDTLLTTDGRRLDLPGVVPADDNLMDLTAVPAGWVYQIAPGQRGGRGMVRFLGRDGRMAGFPGEEYALSPDGERIAWADPSARTVKAATITAAGFTGIRTAAVPESVVPHGWVGDRVALRSGCCGGDGQKYRYDVWDPAGGRYVPTWSGELSSFPVEAGAGRTMYALRRSEQQTCVVQLDTQQRFSEVKSACDIAALDGDKQTGTMLAGRWLTIHSAEDGSVSFLDMSTAFDRGQPTVLTGCTGIVPEQVVEPVGDALLARSVGGGMVRCAVDDGRVVRERLDASGIPEGDVWLVPRIGG